MVIEALAPIARRAVQADADDWRGGPAGRCAADACRRACSHVQNHHLLSTSKGQKKHQSTDVLALEGGLTSRRSLLDVIASVAAMIEKPPLRYIRTIKKADVRRRPEFAEQPPARQGSGVPNNKRYKT